MPETRPGCLGFVQPQGIGKQSRLRLHQDTFHGTQNWMPYHLLGHFLNSLCLIKQEACAWQCHPSEALSPWKGPPLESEIYCHCKISWAARSASLSTAGPGPEKKQQLMTALWDVARMAWGPAGLLDCQTPTVAHMSLLHTGCQGTQWGMTSG